VYRLLCKKGERYARTDVYRCPTLSHRVPPTGAHRWTTRHGQHCTPAFPGCGRRLHGQGRVQSCTFFQTTIEFLPTLERQRDDAAAKGQIGRQRIFDGLLTRLQDNAS
jgi:hypothetical protein